MGKTCTCKSDRKDCSEELMSITYARKGGRKGYLEKLMV